MTVVADAIANARLFAIGGIDATNLPAVVDAGARRVVVVRAVVGAAHPDDAVRQLLSLLNEAPGRIS